MEENEQHFILKSWIWCSKDFSLHYSVPYIQIKNQKK
jgi:hypothetical protein